MISHRLKTFVAISMLLCLAVAARVDPPDRPTIPGGLLSIGRDYGPADEHPAHAATFSASRIDRLR